MKIKNVIEKTLARNDTGETGSHQAGIAIPKKTEILSFFPNLDKNIKNPREPVICKDSYGRDWVFEFVYYNGKFFGGTRNEYRLLKTARFIKEYALKAGDKIIFKKYVNDQYAVEYLLKKDFKSTSDEILIIGNKWRTVSIK